MELSKGQKNLILILNIITTVYAALYLILMFLPIFKGYKYVYPVPIGQPYPYRVSVHKSIFMGNIENGNYIVIFSLIISLACIALSIIALVKLNWKKSIVY